MKKNIFIFTIFISYFFNAFCNEEKNYSESTEKPNKPKITNPLSDKAYQHIYDIFKSDFSTADRDFEMFLQNRYKKTKEEKNLKEEDKLIVTLSQNYIHNQKLNSEKLPHCAFAAGVQSLYFHQFIADSKTYPCNYLLAPFEQNYNFKLYAVDPYDFIDLKNSLPAAQIILYKQTTIRNFAKFLLIALSRR